MWQKENQIAFIVCVNNEIYFEECQYYISRLRVPEGYEIDVIEIREADSMCAAYNYAMRESAAKYKIYMHQDVQIQNTDFLFELLKIFKADRQIGMVGVVGGIGMPKTAVIYLAENVGMVDCREPDIAYRMICDPDGREQKEVDTIDGILMATQYDIPWREDLFQDFDFYDASQSFEMKRAGYKVVVPYQETPWVIHDCGFAKLDKYDRNRKIFQKEYAEFLTEDNGFEFVYQQESEELSDALANEIRKMIEAGDWDEIETVMRAYRQGKMKNSLLEMYGIMSDITSAEKQEKGRSDFWAGLESYSEVYEKYMRVRFNLRRIEQQMPENCVEDFKKEVQTERISCEVLIQIMIHSVWNQEVVCKKILDWYSEAGLVEKEQKMKQIYQMIKRRSPLIAYSKRQVLEQ
ncbi:MAG: glycosyltransferase family protein [Roseburia sp.]